MLFSLFSTAIFAQNTPLPKQWDKRFGGRDDDRYFSIQQTTDGGFVLSGFTDSPISGDKTQSKRGNGGWP